MRRYLYKLLEMQLIERQMRVIEMNKEIGGHVIPVDIDDIDMESGLFLSLKKPLELFFPKGEKPLSESPVEIEVTLTRLDDYCQASGGARGAIRLECGRCLKEYRQELEAEINASFIVKDEAAEEVSDDDVYLYDGVTIDLYQAVREQLLLMMPIKPLCGEDCKGLCPKCGQDLNLKDCGHRKNEVDSRFAVLAKLKKDL